MSADFASRAIAALRAVADSAVARIPLLAATAIDRGLCAFCLASEEDAESLIEAEGTGVRICAECARAAALAVSSREDTDAN